MVVVHLFIILYLTLYHDVKDRSELFACCNHSLTIPSFSSHVVGVVAKRAFCRLECICSLPKDDSRRVFLFWNFAR